MVPTVGQGPELSCPDSESQPESQLESGTSPVPVQFQSLEERVLAAVERTPRCQSRSPSGWGRKESLVSSRFRLNKLVSDSLIEFHDSRQAQQPLAEISADSEGKKTLRQRGEESSR